MRIKLFALYIVILVCAMTNPVAAATHLPLGVPNTSPWVYAALPNQHGMDDLLLHNLSEGAVPLYIGNIVYPPIYESNADVIPWEIWAIFFVTGVLGAFAAFAFPKPEGQVVASIVGMAFSSYAFVLSSMIGVVNIASNPGAMTVYVDQAITGVMINVVQPVYTVYNPPWLWVLILIMVFISIFGFFNACYNVIRTAVDVSRAKREETSQGFRP